jgi:integral membrane sensor domain MASE1
VRCVRILASSDDKKLASIGVILAGTASAIVGVYVSHVVSKAVMTVPLLKTFDRQVSEVFAALLVTAVPLTAIYTFDQNKHKLQFMLNKAA